MFVARCHCGNVSLEANEPPETVTSCNCSICYRIGATWAYYTKEQVAINGINKTKVYLWGQKNRSYHACEICHCVTHYTQLRNDGSNRVAINTRMVNPEQTNGIKIRMFDGAVSFKYVEKPGT